VSVHSLEEHKTELQKLRSKLGQAESDSATAKEHVRQFRGALLKQAGEMKALSAVYANPQLQAFVVALADDLENIVRESISKFDIASKP